MDILLNYQLFADYNKWANTKVYNAAAELSTGEYGKNVSAFFKSMHGTLNHILVADRVWMKRFTGTGEHPATLDAILHENLENLRSDRLNEDQRIIDWVASLDDNSLNGSFTFTPMTNPVEVTQKLAPCLTHFFNHQTHHRGQAHMILSVLGKNPPSLDMSSFLRQPDGARWA